MTVSLSNRQYAMLRLFTKKGVFTIAEIGEYDQRCFRSMLIRGYCKWSRPVNGFVVTEEGLDAQRVYLETDVHRKIGSLRLTSYFDMARALGGRLRRVA